MEAEFSHVHPTGHSDLPIAAVAGGSVIHIEHLASSEGGEVVDELNTLDNGEFLDEEFVFEIDNHLVEPLFQQQDDFHHVARYDE